MSSMFQKRHYDVTARTLLASKPKDSPIAMEQWQKTVQQFINTFARDNPNFHYMTFMKGCDYIEPERVVRLDARG